MVPKMVPDTSGESQVEREAMAFLDAYDTLEEYTRMDANRQQGAMALVNAYRTWGHLVADIAPMSYTRPPYPLLELSEYGFTEEDSGSYCRQWRVSRAYGRHVARSRCKAQANVLRSCGGRIHGYSV